MQCPDGRRSMADVRRQSDSRTAADNAMDVSDLDLNFNEEEAIEDFGEPISGLGTPSNRPSVVAIGYE